MFDILYSFSLNPFYRIAATKIDPIVKPLGFHRYGRFYYRIINDVVQHFCLLWRHYDFTIRFELSSVYEDAERITEGYEIARLIDGSNQWLGLQSVETAPNIYTLTGPSASFGLGVFKRCSDECVNVLQKYLLPFFEKSTNSATAYEASKQSGLLQLRKFSDIQEPETINSLGFLLGMGKIEQAEILLKYYIENNSKYNQRWWQEKEHEYIELLNAIQNKRANDIQNYMNQKKSATYKEFRWKT